MVLISVPVMRMTEILPHLTPAGFTFLHLFIQIANDTHLQRTWYLMFCAHSDGLIATEHRANMKYGKYMLIGISHNVLFVE